MNNNTINDDVTLGGTVGALLANRYRIVRQLGQGGMGSVWLAVDAQLDNREVAIKMLPSILVSNKRAYRQLKSEALVSLKLTHPNIATVRAFEENGGNPFLVVDYIHGVTLDDYLADKGKLSEDEIIRLLGPIASALDYAHGEGVVHRDVKPGNVMIRNDGHPFILDFGIAREIQETMTRVTGKLSSGTLMYMSPEQLHGAAPKSSQDVYSFAAMAYECLMGTPPFSRGQIEYQIEHDAPASINPLFTKCGPTVMAGLAKDPESRPSSCAEVLTGTNKGPLPGGDGLAKMPLAGGNAGGRPAIQPVPLEAEPRMGIGGRVFVMLLLLGFVVATVVLGLKLLHQDPNAPRARSEDEVALADRAATFRMPTGPVVVTNVVVRVETNRCTETVVITNSIPVDPPVAPAANRQDIARKNYLEIARLMTEASLIQSHVAELSRQFEPFKSKAVELGMTNDYLQAERLLSDVRSVSTIANDSHSADNSALKVTAKDLHSASNVLQKVSADRDRLDDLLKRFNMAELEYQMTQGERSTAKRFCGEIDRLAAAAKECDAPDLASVQFDSAMAKRDDGNTLFGAGDYAGAVESYKTSCNLLTEAMRLSRDCKAKAALQSAEEFLRNEKWQQALDKAEESLKWSPNGEKASLVRDKARSRLVPMLTLKATVDSKPVNGAKIVEGAFAYGQHLPWASSELEKGSVLSSFVVEYREGKRLWRGAFKSIKVDWIGSKILTCPLVEVKEGRYECEFVPYFRNWLGTVRYAERISLVEFKGDHEIVENKHGGKSVLVSSEKSQPGVVRFLKFVADGKEHTTAFQFPDRKMRKVAEVDMSK